MRLYTPHPSCYTKVGDTSTLCTGTRLELEFCVKQQVDSSPSMRSLMGSLQAARCHVADLIQIPHEWSSDNDYLHEVFLYKLAHSLGASPLGMQPRSTAFCRSDNHSSRCYSACPSGATKPQYFPETSLLLSPNLFCLCKSCPFNKLSFGQGRDNVPSASHITWQAGHRAVASTVLAEESKVGWDPGLLKEIPDRTHCSRLLKTSLKAGDL